MTNYCGLPPKWNKEEQRKRRMKVHFLECKRLLALKDDWDTSYLKKTKWERAVTKEEHDASMEWYANEELKRMTELMTEEEKDKCRKIYYSVFKDKDTTE